MSITNETVTNGWTAWKFDRTLLSLSHLLFQSFPFGDSRKKTLETTCRLESEKRQTKGTLKRSLELLFNLECLSCLSSPHQNALSFLDFLSLSSMNLTVCLPFVERVSFSIHLIQWFVSSFFRSIWFDLIFPSFLVPCLSFRPRIRVWVSVLHKHWAVCFFCLWTSRELAVALVLTHFCLPSSPYLNNTFPMQLLLKKKSHPF